MTIDQSTLTMLFYIIGICSLILLFILILFLRKIRDYNVYFFKENFIIRGQVRFLGLLSSIVFLMIIEAIIIFYYIGAIPCKIVEIHNAAPVSSDRSDILSDDICSKVIQKVKKIEKLISELDNEIKTDNYEIIPSSDNEIIKDKKGKYYIVDLKDADYKEKIKFLNAKYIINDFDSKFQKAVLAFKNEVFDELNKGKKAELYIKGSANIIPYYGRQSPGYSYNKIRYFVKIQNTEQFSAIFGQDILTKNISNNDLPNLRAKFVQEKLSEVFMYNTPIILQGSVTTRASDSDRNVTLLMFIE
jgi:hypothetical protein